jgi:hypothetical protein
MTMEAEGSSEKFVPIYQTTWRLITGDQNLYTHHRENLKFKVQDDIEIHSVVSEIKRAKRRIYTYTSSPLCLFLFDLKKNAQTRNTLPEVQHLSKVAC